MQIQAFDVSSLATRIFYQLLYIFRQVIGVMKEHHFWVKGLKLKKLSLMW